MATISQMMISDAFFVTEMLYILNKNSPKFVP